MATPTGSGAEQATTDAFICPTVVSGPAGLLLRERLLPVQTIRSIMTIFALGAALLASLVTLVMAEQASARYNAVARSIDAGEYHTCAILGEGLPFASGEVRCWGRGDSGQLGYPATNTVGLLQHPKNYGPVDLGKGRTAVALAAGGFHTCAILDNGKLRCWGQGIYGQLGYASSDSVAVDPGDSPARRGRLILAPVAPPPQSPPASIIPASSSTTAGFAAGVKSTTAGSATSRTSCRRNHRSSAMSATTKSPVASTRLAWASIGSFNQGSPPISLPALGTPAPSSAPATFFAGA
jgi:alpha-tubulin suppressor-like RCC1 family protein